MEVPLREARAPEDLEAERARAEAVESSTMLVREHLQDFLSRNPGATYEAWIASLHPENIQLDHRLRITGNPWLVVWAEAGGNPRVKEILCLQGFIAVLSVVWAGLCRMMLGLRAQNVRSTTTILGTTTVLSVILCILQLGTVLSAVRWLRHEAWPRYVYKVNVGQLLAQSCLVIMGLTSFIFNQHGLSLQQCLTEMSCTTCLACMRSLGLDSEAIEFVTQETFLDGPLSHVDVTITGTQQGGQSFAPVHLNNGNAYWDGIRVQAAMPRHVSFTQVEKRVIGITLFLYVLALLDTFAYVCTYRVLGQQRGRRVPGWLTLKRMEAGACILCLLLILMSIWGFMLHIDALFVAPVFIGITTLGALASQLWSTFRKRHPPMGPFNHWQKRQVTAQGVAVAVAFTYVAGLCDSIIMCSVARIWPTSLQGQGLQVFVWSILINLLLSVGYGCSLFANLHLMRLRAVRQVQNSDIAAITSEHDGGVSASAPARPAPPATSLETESRRSSQEDMECVVCMEELRDTVLVPCGHIALCSGCARTIAASRRPLCPICNRNVDDLCRVYRA